MSDDLTVVVTDYQIAEDYAYWVFSTAWVLPNEGHAVSGNRQFGIVSTGSGYVFFTRGIDRLHAPIDLIPGEGTIFEGGHDLWNTLMKNLTEDIIEMGGTAEQRTPYRTQKKWTDVKR